MSDGTLTGKSKEKTEKNADFAKGGKTKMFSQQSADPIEPGVTADQSATDDLGTKFAKGGSTKMFGFAGSQTATAGITSAR